MLMNALHKYLLQPFHPPGDHPPKKPATLLAPREAKVKRVRHFFRKQSTVSHNVMLKGSIPVISTESHLTNPISAESNDLCVSGRVGPVRSPRLSD
jgi:hypothetical protein